MKVASINLTHLKKSFGELFIDFPFWLLIQINQAKVFRWSKQSKLDHHLRKQSNLQHLASVTDMAVRICFQIQPYDSFDLGMVLSAMNIHEHGEALLLRDVVYNDKTADASTDADEYRAYRRLIEDMYPYDSALVINLSRAFLLQFVTKKEKWVYFPEEAITILEELSFLNEKEAKIFDAIERYEYIYYTLEDASMNHSSQKLMSEVLKNQINYLDKYAKEIPGFNRVWSNAKSELAWKILDSSK